MTSAAFSCRSAARAENSSSEKENSDQCRKHISRLSSAITVTVQLFNLPTEWKRRKFASIAWHANSFKSYLVHGVTVRECADILQLRSRWQFVTYFVHDEVCEVLHALRRASHTDKLRTKQVKLKKIQIMNLRHILWRRRTSPRDRGCRFPAPSGTECPDPSAQCWDSSTSLCHRCICQKKLCMKDKMREE